MNLWKIIFVTLLSESVESWIPQKYKIGVVGKHWFDILSSRLAERGDENRVILKQLTINHSSPFLEIMKSSYNHLSKLQISLIIGDSSVAMAQTTAYIGIPYISVDPFICQTNVPEYSNMPHFYSLPLPEKLYSFAVIDLLKHFSVQKISLITDSSVDYDNFVRPFVDQKSIGIRIWTLNDEVIQDPSKLVTVIDRILEESRDDDVWDFVLKSRNTVAKAVISRAKYYGMLVEPNKWYLPSFLCQDINIAAIRQIYSNITMINELCSESILRKTSNYSDAEIINKAIQLFRKVNWILKRDILYKAFKSDEPKLFDEKGVQTFSQFSMHSININDGEIDNLRLVGVWKHLHNKQTLNYFHKPRKIESFSPSLYGHIRVSAFEEHPHLIVLQNGSMVGFGVDLLTELSKLMHFTYSINLTDSVGSKEHSNWTGIVGEILADRADISLGPLVQTGEVEEVLDFSTSFKQREISLVIRKASPSSTLFQFFSPFSTNLWICCVGILVMFTLTMWLVEHVHDKYFENDEPIKVNLKESSWISIACLLKQQMDIFPRSIPGRIIHWLIIFCSLIIITSYTANLAAFLTTKIYPIPIQSIEDLANLPKNSPIIFGTVKASPIYEFFETSEMEMFKKIHKIMKKNPSWLVNDTNSGYKRALTEPYVFIWDDSVNQYEIFREPEYGCNLISVGRPFGKRSFAIGMKYGSQMMNDINLNLLEIIESGKREKLEQKWWKSKSICTSSEKPSDDQEPLSIDEVSGVFLILVCGTVVSTAYLCAQIIYHKMKETNRRNNRKKCNEPLKHESEMDSLKKDEAV